MKRDSANGPPSPWDTPKMQKLARASVEGNDRPDKLMDKARKWKKPTRKRKGR